MKFEDVKTLMEQDGTYSTTYDKTITIYCDLLADYEFMLKKSRGTRLKVADRKIYGAQLKVLREQIAKYQSMLLLTPQSRVGKKEVKQNNHGLDAALDELLGDRTTGGVP